jgi:hypothetical protein
VPIPTKVVSSNPVYSEVYSIQHYVLKFVSDLRQADVFPPGTPVSSTNKSDRPIKRTFTIELKYCWKWGLASKTNNVIIIIHESNKVKNMEKYGELSKDKNWLIGLAYGV